jgi:hypothetical protein
MTQKVLQKIEHVCGSISLNDQGHSPHLKGEDLLQQRVEPATRLLPEFYPLSIALLTDFPP